MKTKETKKKFTWADFKKAVNKIPEKNLNQEVVIWTEDERCYTVDSLFICPEDFLFDGDEGCCPRSEMKDAIKEEKRDYPDTESEYYVVHRKGTRIIQTT